MQMLPLLLLMLMHGAGTRYDRRKHTAVPSGVAPDFGGRHRERRERALPPLPLPQIKVCRGAGACALGALGLAARRLVFTWPLLLGCRLCKRRRTNAVLY